jgi:hypothetical protein
MKKKKPKQQSAVKWSLYNNEEGFRRQKQTHELKKNKKKYKNNLLDETDL